MMNENVNVIVAYTHSLSAGGIRVHKLPKPGETVRAIESDLGIDAAKGTNTAVVASRCGANVAMLANVPGGDWYSKAKRLLKEENINDECVKCDKSKKKISGCIIVDDEGNNMIVLGSTGEQSIEDEDIEKAFAKFKNLQYCITGYELKNQSVNSIIEKAYKHKIKLALNPSPLPKVKPENWNKVNLLVLNEVEIEYMLKLADIGLQNDWQTNIELMKNTYGCSNIVITLGKNGYVCIDECNIFSSGDIVDFPVKDTTGAGDSFLGALVANLSLGLSLKDSCARANEYSSFTVQKSGTISSYPTLKELEIAIKNFKAPANIEL